MQACPVLRLRRGLGAWLGLPPRRSGAAFRHNNGVGPREKGDFGAQLHGLRAPCVRFVGGVTPALHATLGSGWSLTFAGRD